MLTFADIIKQIESLPPLSEVVLQIQNLYAEGDENVNVIKLIRLIERDATLTANVLKFVNDPKYGFSKKIASVSQAVTLLGTQIVYGIVTDYAMHEVLRADVSAYGVTNVVFNDVCHLQSALVLQWYSVVDLRDAQFLSPLALIMEAGKIVISKEVNESNYATQFRRGIAKMKDIERFEYEMFDTTSYYISALLFEHWNLNTTFVEILKNLDFDQKNVSDKILYFRDILDVVRTAVNVRERLTRNSIAKAAKIVQEIGLSEETFLHVANRLKRSYEQSKGIA